MTSTTHSPLDTGTVVVTPVDEFSTASCLGEVRQFDTGPAGLAIRLEAQVAAAAVPHLDGEAVWVTARLADGQLVAFLRDALAAQLAALPHDHSSR